MSSQVANMQLEQAALRMEVEHLDKAETLEASAAKLIAFMSSQQANDPLLNPSAGDNEWVFDRDQPGCCEVQ